MKKYASLIAILLAVLVLLSACNAGNTGADGESKEPAETTDAVTTDEVTTEEVTTDAVTTDEVTTEEVTTDAPTTELENQIVSQYLSLGDSIANGYGLADQTGTRYSALLAAAMDFNNVASYAVDGQKSSDLLLDVESKTYTGNEMITISTGANNVLGPAMPVLFLLMSSPTDGLSTLYSPAFLAQLDAGVEQLRKDLPKIVDRLRETNADADIVLMTVYNPFAGVNFPVNVNGGTTVVDLGELAEMYIGALNVIIREVAEEKDCVLADVHGAFAASEEQVVNVTLDENGFITTSYDPHPNLKGHEVIAEVIKTAFEEAKKS